MIPLLCALVVPAPITDLRVTTPTAIAWHCTVPAFNDSSVSVDSLGDVVYTPPHRYALASDSVWYHSLVIGLPPPYQREYQDSAFVARGDRISRRIETWSQPWQRLGHLTIHWITRSPEWPMSPQYNRGQGRSLYVLIR